MAWKRNTEDVPNAGGVAGSDSGDGSLVSDGGGSGGGSGGDGGSWGDLFGAELGNPRTGSDDSGGSASTGDDGYVYRDGEPVYNKDGSQRRKRGRGSSSAASGTRKQKVPVDALARFLAFAHMAVAGVTSTPELNLEEKESVMLARPLADILGLYNVEIDPRAMAMMELAGAASYIYGPRFMLIRMRLKEEKLARTQRNTPPVETTEPPTMNGVSVTDFTDASFNFNNLRPGTMRGPN